MRDLSDLSVRLAERIRQEGPLRFDTFHEAALYDPEGGYYERRERVGRAGDFVTGPTWHPAFGRTIARIARRLREEEQREKKKEISAKEREGSGGREEEKISVNGEEARKEKEQEISGKGHEDASDRWRAASEGAVAVDVVDIVDVGAGEGELLLAADEALRAWRVRDEFRLIGVERSAARRRLAAERVPSATWLRSFEEIPSSSLSGLVVCYELFDALPVRAFFFDGEKLLERVVTLEPAGEGFAWGVAECVDGAEMLRRFEDRGIYLPRNQNLEIRSGAAGLASTLASRLSSGLLLVFDYGAPARALYSPARPNGTLEAFHAHSVSRDVLSEPGKKDITAWVDFTELQEAFVSGGLDVAGPVSQARVLSAAGIGAELEDPADQPVTAHRAADRNAIARLVAPGGMGESIRVLVASRGASRVKDTLLAWPE